MSAFTYALNVAKWSYTPFRFRPTVEHSIVVALIGSGLVLWVIVVPLEFIVAR